MTLTLDLSEWVKEFDKGASGIQAGLLLNSIKRSGK